MPFELVTSVAPIGIQPKGRSQPIGFHILQTMVVVVFVAQQLLKISDPRCRSVGSGRSRVATSCFHGELNH
jgi:hypothetical protein